MWYTWIELISLNYDNTRYSRKTQAKLYYLFKIVFLETRKNNFMKYLCIAFACKSLKYEAREACDRRIDCEIPSNVVFLLN